MESGDSPVVKDDADVDADEQDQDQDDSPVLWLRVSERNSWEGETWYHYFLDEEGVEEALISAVGSQSDLSWPRRVSLTWSAAEALANEEPGYMAPHWFGKLTNFEVAQANEDDLYKGKIRSFGEELMSYEDEEEHEHESESAS